MLPLAFDTLKLAQKLEKAGFSAKRAQDMAAAYAEVTADWHANLAESYAEWQNSLNLASRDDLKLEVQKLELATKALEISTKAEFQKLDGQTRQTIAEQAAATIKWVVGMTLAPGGFMTALIKLHS